MTIGAELLTSVLTSSILFSPGFSLHIFPVCQGKISQRTRPSYGVKSSGLDRILVSYFRSLIQFSS